MKGWKRGLPPGEYYKGMEDDFEATPTVMGGWWHRRRTPEEIEQRHIHRACKAIAEGLKGLSI